MAQKPMLQAEVYARALRTSQNLKRTEVLLFLVIKIDEQEGQIIQSLKPKKRRQYYKILIALKMNKSCIENTSCWYKSPTLTSTSNLFPQLPVQSRTAGCWLSMYSCIHTECFFLQTHSVLCGRCYAFPCSVGTLRRFSFFVSTYQVTKVASIGVSIT